MRCILVVALLLALLAFQATDGSAQEVPVTVTLMAHNNAVTAVEFPDILPGVRFDRPPVGRIQHFVGLLGQDEEGQYRTRIIYYTGKGTHSKNLVFDGESTCADPPEATEGYIERIACSVLEDGAGVVCSATYDGMNDPPRVCTGTYACIRCGGVKVCGANPTCAN